MQRFFFVKVMVGRNIKRPGIKQLHLAPIALGGQAWFVYPTNPIDLDTKIAM